MGRKAGRHNQQNTGSHAGPSRGRRVLSIAVNPGDDKSIAMRRDYSHVAQQQRQQQQGTAVQQQRTEVKTQQQQQQQQLS